MVNRLLHAVGIYTNATGRIGLGIEINQQGALFGNSQRRRQIHGCCGFTDATLLVGNGDDLSHASISP